MTAKALACEDFLNQSRNEVIIDVRAPIEFFKGHIPGAVNIPLFDNTERAEIGTIFKQIGKESAVTRGLEIVSPKMVPWVKKVKDLSKNNKVYIYCFRGGMRSNSFAWLMNTSGMNATIMKGGYKAYRNYVLEHFADERKIVLLGGKTGSGKTDVLKALKQESVQIIDLEGLAHHKGSAFGNINEQKQNPQQVFENNLFDEWRKLDPLKILVLEDESQAIGYNKIPHALWQQMKKSPIIKLEIPFELRVEQLLKDYTTKDIEELKKAVIKIAQQLGPGNTKHCLQLLDEGNLREVAILALEYYDKAYEFKYKKKKEELRVIPLELDSMDALENAKKVKQLLETIDYGN